MFYIFSSINIIFDFLLYFRWYCNLIPLFDVIHFYRLFLSLNVIIIKLCRRFEDLLKTETLNQNRIYILKINEYWKNHK